MISPYLFKHHQTPFTSYTCLAQQSSPQSLATPLVAFSPPQYSIPNFLSCSNKKAISNAGNVANQCREWVHDCKKTFQSLEEALRLIINKKEAKAAIAQACKHPVPDNVRLALKEISDADKRIAALQTQTRGYIDALRQ
ncbi:hypothetical protein DER46DRAFT_295248 [Fusarium sp. MPI-SDFR-AT-0072]|nr:hypothetical protein DER46DRAFT_295248 [Fusarium sp. MPI-SDFR-AT-0072]